MNVEFAGLGDGRFIVTDDNGKVREIEYIGEMKDDSDVKDKIKEILELENKVEVFAREQRALENEVEFCDTSLSNSKEKLDNLSNSKTYKINKIRKADKIHLTTVIATAIGCIAISNLNKYFDVNNMATQYIMTLVIKALLAGFCVKTMLYFIIGPLETGQAYGNIIDITREEQSIIKDQEHYKELLAEDTDKLTKIKPELERLKKQLKMIRPKSDAVCVEEYNNCVEQYNNCVEEYLQQLSEDKEPTL